ncbi:MAG: tetratricopeptide repeat protein [Dongiaceae bacterium]
MILFFEIFGVATGGRPEVMMLRFLILLVPLVVANPAWAADRQDCSQFWLLVATGQVGNLNGVVAACRRAAEAGYADAQGTLGLAYATGLGITRDDEQAARWFRKAADQGDGSAQLSLGLAYKRGRGVPLDYVQGYMWMTLAAARGAVPAGSDAAKEQEDLAARMTAAQLSKARTLAAAWVPSAPR